MSKIIYTCEANRDTIEGKGSSYVVCASPTKEGAISIINSPAFYKKFGTMGTKPWKDGIYDIHEIVLYDDAEDYAKEASTESKRARALEKLTDEEKRLLGLVR